MEESRIRVGNISQVSGELNIAGGDIYTGYTSEQVSILLSQITSTLQPKPFTGRCPYKGLDVFEEIDADLFFGRERLVADLVRRVRDSRTVFITGPSGSGKSSLVRAGLIPALRRGAVQDLHSERWLYETMRPGRDPRESLALLLSRLKSPELADYFRAHSDRSNVLHVCAESILTGGVDQRFVLFIDQFEELFTQVNREEERRSFLNILASAATVENGRVIVLFAMRSDFVSNCATYPALNELLSQQFRQIGAMQPEELVSAIALPAKHVGLPVEDELIARIINDMKGEPGTLPLMQFALKDLFDSQQEQGGIVALRLEDYLRHGGIQKSLERHADASFAKLSEGEQQLARLIFSGLIEIGRGTQDTRRTALFEELVPANVQANDIQAIVRKLADARLITTDEESGRDTATISHEKLIDAWPWLKRLVNENRDVIALQNEITGDAKEWNDNQRDPSYLYSGARLANAREQLETKRLNLSGLAFEFVQAGIKAFTDELEAANDEELRKKRLQKKIVAGLTGFTAAIFVLLIFALLQLNISRALQLGAQAQAAFAERNYNAAALFAYQSHQIHANDAADRVLSGLPYQNFSFAKGLVGHTSVVTAVAWSADGRLASGSGDNTVIIWDLDTALPAQILKGHQSHVRSVAWSTDGRLASGSDDGTIIIWDLALSEPAQIMKGHESSVRSVAWSTDGRLASGSDDKTIIIWDLTTGKPDHILEGHVSPVFSVAWSGDGRLASGSVDSSVMIWDLTNNKPSQILKGHTNTVTSVAWSANGELASASVDSTIIVWDLVTAIPDQILKGHEAYVSSVAWSADGRLASGADDHVVIVWDLDTGQPELTLKGHEFWVRSVAWSPEGRLASGSSDLSILLWDLTTGASAQTLKGHSNTVSSMAQSTGGKLASGGNDNAVIIWDLVHGRLAQTLRAHRNDVNSVAWSADGHLASASTDGTVIVWDLAAGEPAQILKGHLSPVLSVAWSQDGRLASGSYDGKIIIWDLAMGQAAQTLDGHTGPVSSLHWSSDGRLASGSGDSTIIIWDSDRGKPARILTGHSGWVRSVAWSSDGRLASGSADNSVIVWNVAAGKPDQILRGHTNQVIDVAWSAEGRLASGSGDSSVIIWDLSTGRPAQTLKAHRYWVRSVIWLADGRLASGADDKTIQIARADIISRQPCDWIYRNMTVEEWVSYQGFLYVYRPACSNLPAQISNSVNAYSKSGDWRYELITWKGRILIAGITIILLLMLGGVSFGLYRFAPRVRHWIYGRKAAGIA